MAANSFDSQELILFLDFDGVLNPEGVGEDLHFVHLTDLEAVLREFPSVQVVVSSAWRLDMSLGELRLKFSQDIRARVIGVTPTLPHLEAEYGQRQRECELWLSEMHPAVVVTPRWLVLDDRECPNLVLLPHVHYDGSGLEGDFVDLLRLRIRQLLLTTDASPAAL